MSQKGPSAFYMCEDKADLQVWIPKEQFRLERFSEVTQSIQGRADGRGIDLLWHSREHILQG